MPKVMIGTMIKNGIQYLNKYFELLDRITFPKEDYRVVFIYGISTDGTIEKIKELSTKYGIKVNIFQEHVDDWLRMGKIYAAGSIWNDMQNEMKDTEDYFLLLDLDLVDYPVDLIEQLIAVNKDVVSPFVWSERHRHFYDSYVFRINNNRFLPTDPPGKNSKLPFKIDQGGTVFLATRKAWKEAKISNPEPYFWFGRSIKERGLVWVACPFIEVFHLDIELLGIYHNPPPIEWSNHGSGWINSNYKVEVVQ